MIRRPPRSTRTDTLFPYTTLVRSEGRRNDVRVNCLAPTAATGMTEGILEEQALAALDPALVAPGMLALVCDDAPNGMILCAGAGSFECAHITLTQGLYVCADAHAPERILAGIDRIRERARSEEHTSELQSLMRISYAVF